MPVANTRQPLGPEQAADLVGSLLLAAGDSPEVADALFHLLVIAASNEDDRDWMVRAAFTHTSRFKQCLEASLAVTGQEVNP